MSDLKCEDCRFYEAVTDGYGECRKYAPRPRAWNPDEEYDDRAVAWIVVDSDEWCGEHSALRKK